MVSRYDIFYIIASNNGMGIPQILLDLNKPKKEYQLIFNHVISLEKEGLVKREGVITPVQNERAVILFRIIDFCISNRINYNLLLKSSMVDFIEKAAILEFFTMKDIDVNPRTFTSNVTILSRIGLLLIISKKPYRCKLLRHGIFSNIFRYYGRELNFYEPTRHSFINEIEKELKTYRRILKIEYSVIDDLRKRQEVEFIYSSLHLEGNPLTLPQTQRLIHEGLYPQEQKIHHINEVTNYKRAVDRMIIDTDQKIDLTVQMILEYHRIAMTHIHGAGEIRKQNVKIQGNPKFKTSDWRAIPKHIMDLMERYEDFRSSKRSIKEIIGFSAFFHNEFQRIHPFIDGNSRISRLLMMFILRINNIPVLDLPLGYYDLYMDLTKRSEERDDNAFASIVEEMIFFSLKRMNER